ncbi:VWA domain-containing protein [Candidatus Woesearchaeota archaeon]|nr:VWA domain-containing protein [Candidatus Woesearchaeota archaeon]
MSFGIKAIENLAYAYLENPYILLLVIPIVVILYFVLRRDFVKMKQDADVVKKKKKLQWIMWITRSIMALLILIAIASPFYDAQKTIEGDPYIKILIDNSSSMQLYESIGYELAQKLEKKLPVEVYSFGSAEHSDVGDAILANLKPRDSVILISDGNANVGSSLGDVGLFAAQLNSTVNSVRLNTIHDDAGVIVLGPAKTQEGVPNTFTVFVSEVGNPGYELEVTLDGQKISLDENKQFVDTLNYGYHKIVARLLTNDYFEQNNVFSKTVKVVPKPKIFYWTENPSPMQTLLGQMYVVQSGSTLPSSLSDYYALAVNNIPAEKTGPASDVITDFIAEGNGMVVIGGEASFDKGDYRNSVFESILPVFVGAPGKKEGEINIILVIDISGSTSAAFGDDKTVDVEKALALGVLNDLSLHDRLGFVAFNTEAYLVSEPSYVYEKQGLEDRVARLADGGGTFITAGLMKAIALLERLQGSKNIILISDGKTQGEGASRDAARLAHNQGIKIYTVGVGPTTNELVMQDIAAISNGIYFRATDSSRLKLLFGDVEEQEIGDTMALIVLNPNHFITADYYPEAAIHGFNNVVPKTSARLLLTTTTGEPVLTVWRLGLGRIAALSTDDGRNWNGDMLGSANSKVVSRMFNWVIGDPDRKSKEFVDVRDTRVFETTELIVRSASPPKAEGYSFYKIDDNMYSSSITPTEVGFHEVLGATFAVNNPSEYETLGFSDELEGVVFNTGGKVFDRNDIDGMVDHTITRSRREIITKENFRWPFVMAVVVLFLIEIFIRRIVKQE